MPWADAEPQELSERVALLRRFRGQFDLGTDFVYGIFDAEETQVLGASGLHTRAGGNAYEIGYWIRASHVRQGLGTESTAALTRVAFELCGVDRVDIKVDPTNNASLAIPRKLGYVEEGTLRRRLPPHVDGVPRDATVFALLREEYPATPCARAAVSAFDALGERVL